MPARTGCCAQCSNVYLVSDDGAVIYKRDFYFDTPSDVIGLMGTSVNGVGRDGDGHFSASVQTPNHPVVSNPAFSQVNPMYTVRQWDGDTGDLRWSWSDSPTGFIVNTSTGATPNMQRQRPLALSLAADATGRVLVSSQIARGTNPSAAGLGAPYWLGSAAQDQMTGLDQDGNVLWSFSVRDHLGWPYNLGPRPSLPLPTDPSYQWPQPDWSWDWNNSINVIGAGTEHSLWRGQLGDYSLFFVVNNSDGQIRWIYDMQGNRPQSVSYRSPDPAQYASTFISPGNFGLFGGTFGTAGYPNGFTLLKDSVAAMDEGDNVWIVVRGPYFDDAGLAAVGNPLAFCLLCKLDESGLPGTAYENSAGPPALTTPAFVALTHIRNPRAITVSPDGDTVVVIGTNELTSTTWIETYDGSATLISTYDATAIFGTVPRLQYTSEDYLAVGQKIWIVDPPTGTTASYSTYRRWTGSNQRGRLQSDGRSVWGGNRDCPGKLATDTTGSLV